MTIHYMYARPQSVRRTAVNCHHVIDCALSHIGGHGVYCIQSDINTGKTRLAEEVIRRDTIQRAIAVTHRVALAQNLVERFGFSDYSNEDDIRQRNFDQIVITSNSLYKLVDNQSHRLPEFDLLILDESEQQLSHLVGGTFKGSMGPNTLLLLNEIVRRAHLVLAMDAHLSDLTIQWLAEIRPDVLHITNQYRSQLGDMTLVEDPNVLMDRVITVLNETEADPKPIVIVSDQKKQVKALEIGLRGIVEGNIFALHGDNSASDDAKDFVTNINDRLPDYRMFVTSPSLSTGVDVQVDIAHVFAWFRGNPLPPQELLQMLGRYRQARNFTVYIPMRMGGEAPTSDIQIYTDDQQTVNWTRDSIELVDGQIRMRDERDRYIALNALVRRKHNTGMNNLYPLFKRLADENYNLSVDDAMSTSDWTEQFNEFNRAQKQRHIQLILSATPVDEQNFEVRRLRGDVSEELIAGYIRWQIETFYRQSVSQSLIKKWNGGRGRLQLLRFTLLYQSREDASHVDRLDEESDLADEERGHFLITVGTLRHLLSIVFTEGFESAAIREPILLNRANTMFGVAQQQPYRSVLATRLDERPDHVAEPIALVRRLLDRIGLELETKKRQQRGRKWIEYKVKQSSINTMKLLAHQRAQSMNMELTWNRSWWVQNIENLESDT